MIVMAGERAAEVQHFLGLSLTLDGLAQILYVEDGKPQSALTTRL
jgi:hypothetical protein